jgi:hypothetical protein
MRTLFNLNTEYQKAADMLSIQNPAIKVDVDVLLSVLNKDCKKRQSALALAVSETPVDTMEIGLITKKTVDSEGFQDTGRCSSCLATGHTFKKFSDAKIQNFNGYRSLQGREG